jgi:uncharacterized linocin/CFP29 family protein
VDTYCQEPWTEAQWARVQEAVRDEARKQRVAASFLKWEGPLPADLQTTKLLTLNVRRPAVGPRRLEVRDFTTRRLTSLSVNVALRGAQVAEPDLSSALVAFRRAAGLIARAEDQLVFQGQPGVGPWVFAPARVVNATGGARFRGLLGAALFNNVPVRLGLSPNPAQLVAATSRALSTLERQGHLGPFAMILGTRLFDLAHTPTFPSLVLPADRIKPLLDGPLLRSSTLNWFLGNFDLSFGLVVSLAAELVDLVVASEIGVRLQQVTAAASPRHMFRVSQRFSLRVKQPTAVVALTSWW